MSKSLSLLVLSLLAGCGGASPAASSPKPSGARVQETAALTPTLAGSGDTEAAEESAKSDEPPAEEAAPLEVPSECAEAGAKICTPPAPFVTQLCQSKSADFALSMFRKSTPWTRAYLRRNMEA